MKRVLVVSPHFPPVNAPDAQRIRMSLPFFAAAGWEITVLTVNDPTPAAPVDPELLATLPTGLRVERVYCLPRSWTRWLGIGNVALRAFPFLFTRGCGLLARERYDVVYFSTTMFSVLPFGRVWRRLYGVPYVIDLQDPWVTDYYDRPGSPRPPGGWKYGVSRRINQVLEGWTLRRGAHVISVSADYPAQLTRRYPELSANCFTVLPFSAPEPDLDQVRRELSKRAPLLPAGDFRIAFAGALGPGMLGCAETLLAAVAEGRRRGWPVSAHFFGTSYAGTGRAQAVLGSLVEKYGLQSCVTEQPARLRYLDALQVTLEAEVNLLLGSNDLGFTPSKLLALLAAGRPVLAIAHAGGALAVRLAQLGQPAVLLTGPSPDAGEIATTVARLARLRDGAAPPVSPPADLSAAALALRQLEVLAQAAETGALSFT